MQDLEVTRPGELPPGALQGPEPQLLRGLVAHWPLVQEAADPAAVAARLRAHWRGATVGVWRAPPQAGGRFFYTDDFRGFNFSREIHPFPAVLDELLALQGVATPPALYMGSTTLDTCLPGLGSELPLALDVPEPLASLWLGNRACVATHQDWPDNLACVLAGRRRFTLFPPDCVADLYIGPLDLTPAGQPVSLVDARAPDLQRFPRFAAAQARAQVVELAPGDALYIPSLWWHQVEALEPFNLLLNYWWRRGPAWADSPMQALWLALATVRDLPAAERQAWRALFDHYVFDAPEPTHIPAHARGPLAPLDEAGMRRLRALLLNRLNR